MKRFKQYLLERLEDGVDTTATTTTTGTTQKPKESVLPNRRDYADTPEGMEQWKADTRAFAQKERGAAEQQTQSAASMASGLQTTSNILKGVKTVADTTLSVGAAIDPTGVGAGLNAVVKGVNAAMDVGQGNYGSAAMNVIDAALPVAGKLATGAKAAETAGSLTKTVAGAFQGGSEAIKDTATGLSVLEKTKAGLETAKEAGKAIAKPLEAAAEYGAKKLGISGAIGNLGSASASLAGVGEQGSALAGKAAEKIGTKLVAGQAADKAKELGSEAKEKIETVLAGTQEAKPTQVVTSMSSSASNFRGKTNIPKA